MLVPLAFGVAAAVATAIFGGAADADGLDAGLASLITVNAVVVGLCYATTQRALSFSAASDEQDSYVLGVAWMVTASMLGILFGVGHLVWGPEGVGLLPLVALLLVGAPALLPVLAVQERLAQAAEAAGVAQRLADEDDDPAAQDARTGEPSSGPLGLVRVRRRDFVADTSNPFENDVLGREPLVRAFCSVLTGVEAPVVLSLEAGWGSGKTAFARMCSAWMWSGGYDSRGVSVVEFNAWTQGYTGEPVRDIVEAITTQITDPDTEKYRQISKALSQQAARLASGGLINDAIFAIGDGPHRQTRRFKSAVRDYVKSCGGRLVVFIDELDRCRPDYAIGVLERARHLFDVDGVVVVLVVNRESLDHAASELHGPRGEGYMRRFIDHATRIPVPSETVTSRYLEHLYQETGIHDRMTTVSYTRHIFEVLSQPEHSSLRSLEQNVYRVAMVFSSIPKPPDQSLNLFNPMWAWEQTAMTLMILRETNLDAYSSFVSGYGDAFAAGQAVRAISDRDPPMKVAPYIMQQMELVLLLSRRHGQEPMLNEEFWQQYVHADRENDMNVLREQYEKLRWQILRNEPEIEHLAGLIEMTVYDPPERQPSKNQALQK